MVALRDDLRLALDRVAFAKKLGIVPDQWQEDFLRSSADRVLLNCSRQSGKSTMSALIALHRALYHPGSRLVFGSYSTPVSRVICQSVKLLP
jgi:hypothetical protein